MQVIVPSLGGTDKFPLPYPSLIALTMKIPVSNQNKFKNTAGKLTEPGLLRNNSASSLVSFLSSFLHSLSDNF